MKTEKEYRYKNINKEEMLKKLSAMQNYKEIKFLRAVFDVPGKSGWMRLRKENESTTLTVKEKNKETGFYFEEEISVSSFEDTLKIFEYLGFAPRAVQENIRYEAYLGETQICLDLWPGIDPYVEIEFKNESDLIEAEKYMSLSVEFRSLDSVEDMYKDVGIDIKHTNVKF